MLQRHLLRIWNFLDSINEGDGDLERYRQFCVGRSRGLGDLPAESLPAATAVGRRRATGHVQVCWLAGRRRDCPSRIRGKSAPIVIRAQYGPSPPSFARAMRLETGRVDGIRHLEHRRARVAPRGDLAAQIDETLGNLRELHHAGGVAGAVAR